MPESQVGQAFVVCAAAMMPGDNTLPVDDLVIMAWELGLLVFVHELYPHHAMLPQLSRNTLIKRKAGGLSGKDG